MYENKIICYICKKECIGNIGEQFYAIGKDEKGKELYRHLKCKPDMKVKIRKTWTRHPATKVKPSDKLYDRNTEKQKFRKDLENE